jgi:hypothetical protein
MNKVVAIVGLLFFAYGSKADKSYVDYNICIFKSI